MRQGQSDVGHDSEIKKTQSIERSARNDDFVLEKGIFNNIFEKDIRRVFIYKKAERLAKAIHLIAPAFAESEALRSRANTIAITLVDAAVLPPTVARVALSRELLTLSSILSIAHTGGLLSAMNADLIAHEAHLLLQEIAAYEEPRLSFDETTTLSTIAKKALQQEALQTKDFEFPTKRSPLTSHRREIIKDTPEGKGTHIKDRRNAIMSVIKSKRTASIKDISTLIRDVSEKTIQRELSALIEEGVVVKQGERRWSTYSLS